MRKKTYTPDQLEALRAAEQTLPDVIRACHRAGLSSNITGPLRTVAGHLANEVDSAAKPVAE